MSEVSCRALDLLLREVSSRRIPLEALVEGTDLTVDDLEDRHRRISWKDYRQVMGNASRHFNDEQFVALGHGFFSSRLIQPFSAAGRLLFSARDFYFVIGNTGAAGNQLFSCVRAAASAVGSNRIAIELTLPEGYETSRPFFLITRGAYEYLPKLVGLPPTTCKMSEIEGGFRYEIEVPEGHGWLYRLRQSVTWPFRARAVANALEDSNRDLIARNIDLEHAHNLLERQARQLRVAYAVSEAVHRQDLDPARTVEAVAQAMVVEAGFLAARVSIDTAGLLGPILHDTRAGSAPASSPTLSRELQRPGELLGMLHLWLRDSSSRDEAAELLDTVMPAIALAIGDALSHGEVVAYRGHLEQKVSERTEELSTARDRLAETVVELRDAQAARDRFFANISHEVRSPLTLVRLATAELSKAPEVGAEGQASLAAIDANVGRLLHLVDGLLLLAAGQEGKLRLRPTRLDLAHAVRDMVQAWLPMAGSRRIELRYEGPDELLAVADRPAIERIVSNLVSNATKFTPAQGLVRVRLELVGSQLVVEVADTGVGIEPEAQSRLFQRFEQGPAPLHSGERGSGIGLALVRELVQAHDGEVELESHVGVGTKIRVTMPHRLEGGVPHIEETLDRSFLPTAATQAPPIASPEETLTDATVLVAEDDPGLLAAMGKMLATRYRVLLAPDGKAALQLAEQHRPDLLLTDLEMPEMDGLELARRFRAIPSHALVPVLVVTAHHGLEDRLQGFAAGAVDYVTKPFQAEELMARVGALLALRHRAMTYQVQEKLLSLGMLSASLAHEIRNPVNGIVNALPSLRALLPPEAIAPGSGAAELIAIVEKCADQVATLSKYLLGFVDKAPLVLRPADIGEVVDRATVLLGKKLDDVEIERDFAHEGLVPCAPPFLCQVFVNLLDNAAQAVGPRGRIRLSTASDDDLFTFVISDTGPGVPAALQSRLFEPFVTTKSAAYGTGLGLFTARQIMERHGGSIVFVAPSSFRVELSMKAPRSPKLPHLPL